MLRSRLFQRLKEGNLGPITRTLPWRPRFLDYNAPLSGSFTGLAAYC